MTNVFAIYNRNDQQLEYFKENGDHILINIYVSTRSEFIWHNINVPSFINYDDRHKVASKGYDLNANDEDEPITKINWLNTIKNI